MTSWSSKAGDYVLRWSCAQKFIFRRVMHGIVRHVFFLQIRTYKTILVVSTSKITVLNDTQAGHCCVVSLDYH